MSTSTPGEKGAPVSGLVDSSASWYALGIVTAAYALAYVCRQMLGLLVDPIKHSLLISDTQFSLIQGTAFVTAYLIAVPVFGRLVDLTNRRNILVACICLWSVFTAFCGYAHSFTQLFTTRFGVGLSEACIFPVGMSLIADYFSARRAPRALSVFTIGSQLGGGFSLVASGMVIGFASYLALTVPSLRGLQTWQMVFVVIGVPGLLFGALALTMREPPRRKILVTDTADRSFTLGEAAAILWNKRGFYARIYLTIGSIGVVQLGIPSWFPAFLIRAHHMSPAVTGYRLGALSVIFGCLGTLSGPFLSRWMERRGHPDAPLRAAACATFVMMLFCLAIPLAPSATGALVVATGMIFCCGFPTGIVAAATQHATASRMQGAVASLYTFFAQLIGYGIGPTVIALFTDHVFHDPKMVGYSMQIVMTAAAISATLLLLSVLPYHRRLVGEAADLRTVPPATPTPSQPVSTVALKG